jgi:hypothetical protein
MPETSGSNREPNVVSVHFAEPMRVLPQTLTIQQHNLNINPNPLNCEQPQNQNNLNGLKKVINPQSNPQQNSR